MTSTLYENKHVRLKECRHGPMLYFTTDQYVGRSLDRYGEYSEGEVDLFRQVVKPGHIVLEVGANIGAHTVFLAKACAPGGAVIAMEPQRVIFQMLCANVALNALTNVHTHMIAAGEKAGSLKLPPTDYGAEGNFGGISLDENAAGESAHVAPIDAMGLKACHLMKIDAEGMEGPAIAGAEVTIKRCRPLLYVENDRREKSPALIAQLFALDYRLYWHLPRLFNTNNHAGESENVFGKIVSVNMVGVPRENPVQVAKMREITTPDADWRQPG